MLTKDIIILSNNFVQIKAKKIGQGWLVIFFV